MGRYQEVTLLCNFCEDSYTTTTEYVPVMNCIAVAVCPKCKATRICAAQAIVQDKLKNPGAYSYGW